MSAHILNIFIEKTNTARRLQFSPHDSGTVRVLCIVACLLRARNVEPEKQPLLSNGCVTCFNGVTVESAVFYMAHADS
jgi:hypothetical protein